MDGMNDFRADEAENRSNDDGVAEDSRASVWPGVIIVVLILVAGVAIVYAHSQKADINAMAVRDASLNANVAQLQNQLQSTTARLNDMVAQQQAAARAAQAQAQAEAAKEKQRAAAAHRRGRVAHRHVLTASEKRYKALQDRLDAQQKQLNDTDQSIAQTRSALEASLDSTRSDLNGSIARNHTELVALEKRGLRNYTEFDLSRSKQFSHAGPIELSLRHADTKHSRYNMMLLVDDNRLEKKNVDLYEPIWISSSDEPQPLEIVVNKITKNHIHGYISAPKYSNAELTSDGASMQPVSATSASTSSSTASGSAPVARTAGASSTQSQAALAHRPPQPTVQP
jgi:hypothetical protein